MKSRNAVAVLLWMLVFVFQLAKGGYGYTPRSSGSRGGRSTSAPKKKSYVSRAKRSSSSTPRRKRGNGARSGKTVSSSSSTGCYTTTGRRIHNPGAYAATGAPVKNKHGKRVNAPVRYARKVQHNSMLAAARAAKKANPKAKAFTYVASLDGGKRYVGYSTNPEKRIGQHISERGAKVTKELKPRAVTITPHQSAAAAKKAETKTYYQQKKKLGGDRVRGAGNTSRFSKSKEGSKKTW
jgi:predicted GIY-YIG superfamily endonuclease